MNDKHLRIKAETHEKFLKAKGLLAIKGKFKSLQEIADEVITKYIKELINGR